MRVKIGIDAKALMAALAAAPIRTRTEMVKAMQQGVKLVAETARRNHRYIRRSGHLELSTEGKLKSADPLIGAVMAGGKLAPYAVPIHEGSGLWGPKHERYPIEPKAAGDRGKNTKAVLSWPVKGGGFAFAKKVMHPGVRPDPFLTQAAAVRIPELERLFRDAIMRSLAGGSE